MPLPKQSALAMACRGAGDGAQMLGAALATIAYLVHDLNDPAVARRVRMFREGGADVRLAGFYRRALPADVAGVAPVDLGRTADARLAQRASAVLRHVLLPSRVRALVKGADTIVARNLESLAIAVRAASLGQRVVYECLDIHRLLLSEGRSGRMVRGLEGRLLRRVSLILTSSPAFVREHFTGRQRYAGPVHVEENRLLIPDGAAPTIDRAPAGTRLRVGWFGMLRCSRSLAILRALAADGDIEVLLAGVPSYTEFEDFDRDVADVPGLRFLGRYDAADLPQLYGSVDCAWAIDYFEAGLNSAWLLPNRLYESIAFGAIPIAQRGVETARWLEAHGVGLLLADPERDAAAALTALDPMMVDRLRTAVAAVPPAAVIATTADCRRLADVVTGAAGG